MSSRAVRPPRPRQPAFVLSEPEEVLQRKILQLAAALGWRAYHTYRSEHSPSGFPDLVLVRGFRLIFAELKSERGVITAEQQAWLEELGNVPCAEVHIWRPSQFDHIVEVLGR